STPQQDVVRSCGGHLGCRRAGEPYDCRMGRHVAADADLSLRLVASAATKQDLCQVEPHACGTRPEKQELSRSRKRDGADLAGTPSAVVLRERVTTRRGGHIGGFIAVSVVLGIAMVAETLLLLWVGWSHFGLATDNNPLYTFSFL